MLLGFGAVREFSPAITQNYRLLLRAVITGDRALATRVALELGLFAREMPRARQDAVMTLFDVAVQPLRNDGIFDFGTTDIETRLRDGGMDIAANRDNWHIPPMDALFLQRKIGGTFLLASRLNARVHIRAILEKYI